MKYYLYNEMRYFQGSKDFPGGIKPTNGTPIPPNNEPNQKWMGNEWKNVPKRQKTLDELKAIKEKEAVVFYQNIINNNLSDVADFEIQSWEVQRAELLKYRDGVNALTPYCDTLSTARGIDKSTLMDKIEVKILSGAGVQGTLHKKLDEIKACINNTELNAVVFE